MNLETHGIGKTKFTDAFVLMINSAGFLVALELYCFLRRAFDGLEICMNQSGIVSKLSHLNAATVEGGFELKSSCCGGGKERGMERYFNDEILLTLSSNTLHTIFQILC